MTAQITYKGFDNEDQQARIHELMLEVRPLFPKQTRNIYVNLYDQIAPGDNSSTLMIEVGSMEYLFFTLNVYYAFFDTPRAKQRAKIIHEIVHALQADLLMFDRDNLIDYIKAKNPDLGDYLFREHRQRVERMTQYLAFAIDEAMDHAKHSAREGTPFVAKEGQIATIMLKDAHSFPGRLQDSGDAIAFSGVSAIAKKRAEIWPESLTTSGSDREI